MNAFPRSILFALAALVLALVVFLRFDRIRSQTEVVTALSSERDALRGQLAAALRRLSERERSLQAGEETTDAGAPDPTRSGAPGEMKGLRIAGAETFAMEPVPAARPEWMDAHLKANLKSRYEPLLRKLGFPADRQEAFLRLLFERQTAPGEVFDAMFAQGLSPGEFSPASVRTMVQEAQTQVDGRLRALLGEAAYADYKSYEESLPYRSLVEQLAGKLAWSGDSLSSQQSEQLLRILAANAPDPAPGSGPGDAVVAFAVEGASSTGGVVSSFSPQAISDQAIDRAGSVLSAEQLAALRQLQADRAAAQQMFATLPAEGPRFHAVPVGQKKK